MGPVKSQESSKVENVSPGCEKEMGQWVHGHRDAALLALRKEKGPGAQEHKLFLEAGK